MRKLPQVKITTNEITEITRSLYSKGYSDIDIYEALNGDASIGAIRRAIINIEKEQV